MKATVQINPGVCGFVAQVEATTEDGQAVTFDVKTDCQKIQTLAELLAEGGPLDAYQEIDSSSESRLMSLGQSSTAECCRGCVVPAGMFKAMEVAAGLALPKDVGMTMSKDETP